MDYSQLEELMENPRAENTLYRALAFGGYLLKREINEKKSPLGEAVQASLGDAVHLSFNVTEQPDKAKKAIGLNFNSEMLVMSTKTEFGASNHEDLRDQLFDFVQPFLNEGVEEFELIGIARTTDGTMFRNFSRNENNEVTTINGKITNREIFNGLQERLSDVLDEL